MLPPMIRSGAVVDMTTSEGLITFRMLELNDPEWLNIDWDFPYAPREDDDAGD